MKYSEFLQLKEVLDKEGKSIEDFKLDAIDNELFEGEGESLLRLGGLSLGKLLKYWLLYAGGKGLIGLIQKGFKTAVSGGIEKEFKEKLDQDAVTIKNLLTNKLDLKSVKKDSKEGGDEVIKKLDQQSEATIKAIIEKRYPNNSIENEPQKDEIIKNIKEKVHKHQDQEIIKYMQNLLKDESDKVLKSIEQKEKLTKEDKENLELYWQSKMTLLKIELSTILAQQGFIDEDNMKAYYDILRDQFENFVKPKKKEEEEPKLGPINQMIDTGKKIVKGL